MDRRLHCHATAAALRCAALRRRRGAAHRLFCLRCACALAAPRRCSRAAPRRSSTGAPGRCGCTGAAPSPGSAPSAAYDCPGDRTLTALPYQRALPVLGVVLPVTIWQDTGQLCLCALATCCTKFTSSIQPREVGYAPGRWTSSAYPVISFLLRFGSWVMPHTCACPSLHSPSALFL